MATRSLTGSGAKPVQKNPKSDFYHVVEVLNDIAALVNELRTDHLGSGTSYQVLLTELVADHATFRTAATDARSAVRNAMLSDPGLRIDGGSASAVAEAQTAFYALADGTIVLTAAGTNMPALAGTVSNGDFGIYLWTIDSAGTITQATLATGASLGAITFPAIPEDEAVVGAVIVNPTGTGDFVGGTTDLDDGTVTPNAVFLDGHNIGMAVNPAAGAAPAAPTASVPAAPSGAAVDDFSFRTIGTP